jgi:nucleotide-binding universal stress UspA family protein
MYQKILVAYDGSSFSGVALRQAASLAQLCKAELHLVGIVATAGIAAMAEGVGGIDIWGMEREALAVAIEKAAQEISGQSLKVKTSIREGIPAKEIATCAAELEADIVVVGHSGKGVLARWLEGSVGEGLLRDLPCNLLVATGSEAA